MGKDTGPGEGLGNLTKCVGGNAPLGLTAGVPGTGSAAVAVYNGEAAHRQRQRFEGLVRDLLVRLQVIKSDIDQEFVQSESFEDLFADAATESLSVTPEVTIYWGAH